jgi:hypothetical protein
MYLYTSTRTFAAEGKKENLDPFYISTLSDIHGVFPNSRSVEKIGLKHNTKY